MTESEFSKPVRISLPASVAAEIGSFKKAVGSILDKLGCAACCSGHDIYLDLQRDFVFRELGEAAVPLSTRSLTVMRPAEQVNRVGLNPRVADKIDNVFAAIDRIADFSGCPKCCSGMDLRMQLERNFVLDSRLNIEEQVMRFG